MFKYLLVILTAFAILGCGHYGHSDEHGGKEHGGKEHGGKEHGGKEHGGKDAGECPEGEKGDKCRAEENDDGEEGDEGDDSGSLDSKKYWRKASVKEIKEALTQYIAEQSDANGIYKYVDRDRGNNVLNLKFVKIHDPVRVMTNKGRYFACTDFEIMGKNGRLHDLDFWLTPTKDGLEVTETKVHKDPIWKDKKWEKKARYTFKGEEIVSLTR